MHTAAVCLVWRLRLDIFRPPNEQTILFKKENCYDNKLFVNGEHCCDRAFREKQ